MSRLVVFFAFVIDGVGKVRNLSLKVPVASGIWCQEGAQLSFGLVSCSKSAFPFSPFEWPVFFFALLGTTRGLFRISELVFFYHCAAPTPPLTTLNHHGEPLPHVYFTVSGLASPFARWVFGTMLSCPPLSFCRIFVAIVVFPFSGGWLDLPRFSFSHLGSHLSSFPHRLSMVRIPYHLFSLSFTLFPPKNASITFSTFRFYCFLGIFPFWDSVYISGLRLSFGGNDFYSSWVFVKGFCVFLPFLLTSFLRTARPSNTSFLGSIRSRKIGDFLPSRSDDFSILSLVLSLFFFLIWHVFFLPLPNVYSLILASGTAPPNPPLKRISLSFTEAGLWRQSSVPATPFFVFSFPLTSPKSSNTMWRFLLSFGSLWARDRLVSIRVTRLFWPGLHPLSPDPTLYSLLPTSVLTPVQDSSWPGSEGYIAESLVFRV